jgi:ATP-binding cassette, subfamily C, bacterial
MANPSAPGMFASDNPIVRQALGNLRNGLYLVGAFSIIVNVLMLTTSVYLMQISDRVMVSRSNDTLILLTVGAIFALIILVVFDFLRKIILARLGVKIEASLGGPLLAASIEKSIGGTATDAQGLRDLSTLRGFMNGPVMPTLFDVPTVPFYMFVIFMIHWQLGLLTLAGCVVLAFFARLNQVMTKAPLEEASRAGSIALARASAQVRNADAVRSMGMIGECVAVWGGFNVKSLNVQMKAAEINAVVAEMSKFSRLVLQIAILGWGSYLALHGEITSGMSIACSIIGARALAPVEAAIESWKSVVGAMESYNRVNRLMSASVLAAPRTILPAPKGEIVIDKLVYAVQTAREPIIKQISFGIFPGTSVAMIGSTGAGKSTLGRLIIGALPVTSGTIRLDGSDLRNWDPTQLGRSVGYLPQDVELFPGTIAENIARLRTDVSSEDVLAAAKFAGVHDLIVRLKDGYETVVHERGAPLSGGQRQRVALARAFFGMPKLVVLDEPDAALDQEGELALMRALANAKEAGMTVLVTTQRRNILGALEKILVLRDGMIELYGPRDQVLERMAQTAAGQQAPAPAPTPVARPVAVTEEAGKPVRAHA